MSKAKLQNFDAWLAGNTAKPHTVVAFGGEVEIPAEEPAIVVLYLSRVEQTQERITELLSRGEDAPVSDEEADEIRRAARSTHDLLVAAVDLIAGEGTYERWVMGGASDAAIGRWLGYCRAIWSGVDMNEVVAAMGEAKGPNRAQRRAEKPKTKTGSSPSSSTGERSKPTSAASTASS